jgi:hypothetical protein
MRDDGLRMTVGIGVRAKIRSEGSVMSSGGNQARLIARIWKAGEACSGQLISERVVLGWRSSAQLTMLGLQEGGSYSTKKYLASRLQLPGQSCRSECQYTSYLRNEYACCQRSNLSAISSNINVVYIALKLDSSFDLNTTTSVWK